MKKCTYCGENMSGDFCPKCGKKYESKSICCPKCGEVLWDNLYHNSYYKLTTFCGKCGCKLENNVYNIIGGLKMIDDVLYEVVDKNIESIVIPKSIKYIRKCAFYGCMKLKRIHIVDKLKEIDEGAFTNCGGEMKIRQYWGTTYRENLSITCDNMTKLEWLNLGKGTTWWHTGRITCSVYCSDGSFREEHNDD